MSKKIKEAVSCLLAIGTVYVFSAVAQIPPVSDLKEGDIVRMGTYEQDEGVEGEEPIEWRVLRVNEDGSKALLITRYCIDCLPFMNVSGSAGWNDSFIRQQLNGDFYYYKFSDEEKDVILETEIETGQYTESDQEQKETMITRDYFFLLSSDEVAQFFSNKSERRCGVVPLLINESSEDEEDTGELKPAISDLTDCIFWWLRTPGDDRESIQCIGAEGSIVKSGFLAVQPNIGLRPAVWVGS